MSMRYQPAMLIAPPPPSPSGIHLVRHAESTSNAGLPTQDAASIVLSDKGRLQAEHLATQVMDAPDLIVVSPYLRTRLTAAPLCEKFPQAPVEEWPVHEFTYLAPACYAGTTEAERAAPARAYWERLDPEYRDGGLGESFASLIRRVDALHQRLLDLPAPRGTLVFSHGLFIRAWLWRRRHPRLAVDRAFMRGFRESAPEVANGTFVPVHL